MAPPGFIVRLLAPQLARPRGLFGRVVAAFMNRGNRRMNAFTIESLALRPEDRVLEVGFGGGLNLLPLLDRVPRGAVVGIDPSDTMVDAARARHRSLVASGRLRLERGVVEQLPLDDGAFDAISTVNTIYFWKDPAAGACELMRVLRSGGRLAITLLPRDRMEKLGMPREIFRYWAPEEVQSLLTAAGFADVRVRRPENVAWVCVTATRPD